MEVLGVLFLLVALVAIPFIVLGAAFKVLFALVLLPFRLIAALASAVFGLFAGLLGIVAGGAGLLVGLVMTVVVIALLPLAPLLLLAGIVWLAFKILSPPVVRAA